MPSKEEIWAALESKKQALAKKPATKPANKIHINVIKFRELIESKKGQKPYRRIYERFVKKRRDGHASREESLLRDLFDVLEAHWKELNS